MVCSLFIEDEPPQETCNKTNPMANAVNQLDLIVRTRILILSLIAAEWTF